MTDESGMMDVSSGKRQCYWSYVHSINDIMMLRTWSVVGRYVIVRIRTQISGGTSWLFRFGAENLAGF